VQLLFKYSIGIDIADDVMRAVLLKGTVKSQKIISTETIQIKEGNRKKEKYQYIKKVIDQISLDNRVGSIEVYVGIPRKSVIIREIEFPYAVKENIQNTLQYEFERYVPFSIENSYFDYQIIDQDKSKNSLTVLLTVVRRDLIEPLLELIKYNRIGISGIEFNSTAIVNALCYSCPSISDNYFVIKTDSSGVEVISVQDGCLRYSINIEDNINSQNIAAAVGKIGFSTEQIKEKKGQRPQYTSLVNNNHKESANFIIKEIGTQLDSFDWNESNLIDEEFISAYGLALKGVENVPMKINILPVQYRKAAGRLGIYVMYSLFAFLLLCCITLGGGYYINKRALLKNLNGEINQLSPQVEIIGKMENEIGELENWTNQFNNLNRNGILLIDIINELTERIPENTWIKDFKYSIKGVEIKGIAVSAADLIGNLEESPIFKDVLFLSAINKEKDGKEIFRIGMQIE
jgi:Tfp pilus assembly PilM family ATPase/Tfp pilus assembly protein PilN